MSLHTNQIQRIREDFSIRLKLDKYKIIRQDRWHTLWQRKWIRVYVDETGIFIYKLVNCHNLTFKRLSGHAWEYLVNRRFCDVRGKVMLILPLER